MSEERALTRWRLVLGRFAQDRLGCLSGCEQRMDALLEFLYQREYQGRGLRPAEDASPGQDREAGLESSGLSVPRWLSEARDVFPQETLEVLQRHALDRYGLKELVTDPQVLESLEPDYDLLKTLLGLRSMLSGPVLELARRIIRQVVEQLRERLAREVQAALVGRLSRRHRSPLKVARNLDVRKTIRDNLKNFDPERGQLVLGSLSFFSRVRRHLPWHIIMAVDCSGSMMDSVIHSAVMAGIFQGVPTLKVSLVAFDTRVVDLTSQVDDPCELLMSVQLGGGTSIGRAVNYCERLVENPTRTILVLVTDFIEGDHPQLLLSALKRLASGGVRLLGLAALDSQARPVYDREIAGRCQDQGMEVAAMTPAHLADWLAGVIA